MGPEIRNWHPVTGKFSRLGIFFSSVFEVRERYVIIVVNKTRHEVASFEVNQLSQTVNRRGRLGTFVIPQTSSGCLYSNGVAYQSPRSGASASAPWVRPNERVLHQRCYIAFFPIRILIDHPFVVHGFVSLEE